MKNNRWFKKTILMAVIAIILISLGILVFNDGSKNIEKINNSFIKSNQYVLELEVRQKHVSLSIGTHMKDAINAFEFKVPVSKEYFYSVEEGDILADDFRFGSLVTEGTVGKWKVTIKDKINQNVDESEIENIAGQTLTLNIKQTHFSLDIGKHIKDSMNDIIINIKVDDDYYNAVKKGDVIIKKFRWGSLFNEGSFGHWEVVVGSK